MRLPSVRTQFLAFLIPFVGVTLTFGGTGITARRASNTQSSRPRVNRTMRVAVGHELDVIHEEPDKRWSNINPDPSSADRFSDVSTATVATPAPVVASPRAEQADSIVTRPDFIFSSLARSTERGRAPPILS